MAKRVPTFRTPSHAEPTAASTRAAVGHSAATEMGMGTPRLARHIERRRNPRLLGALAYAIPLVPALALLLRERRNRFVRAHAAQALTFFAALALAQITLFALLVVAGGLTTSLRTATVVAAVFVLAWLAIAALAFVAWTRLVGAALAGHVATLPLLTPVARRLLRGLDRIAGARNRGQNDRQSAAEGAPRRMTFS